MEEKKFKLESLEKETKKNPALDEGVTIKFTVSPRKLLKWTLVILILVLVFFAGRLTANGACDTVVEVTGDQELAIDDESASKVSGFFKSLFAGEGTTAAVTVENNTTDAEDGEDVVEEVVEPAEEEPVEVLEPEVEEEEPVITSYSKVAVSFTDVSIEWKETWGKIKGFKYTVKNNEAGTIEPSYFMMMVEGYDDVERKVPIPKSSHSLKAGVTASSVASLSNGFAYNELSAGDLSSVDLTITMYDASGVEMAQFEKTVDLNGE